VNPWDPVLLRRSHLTVVLVAAAATALRPAGCGGGSKAQHPPRRTSQHFLSRPDLKPPKISVNTPGATAPGYVFIAPQKNAVQHGPLIVDNNGQPVWFHPLPAGATDFRVQHYRGRPVLTWWQGHSKNGIGRGDYVIMDASYRQIATVRAGHGLAGDEHEFLITPRGTALITIYSVVPADLSAVGGPKRGKAFDSIFQEIDIASGRVLYEWHSIGHVPLTASYSKVMKVKGKYVPYDYFHINSIEDEPGFYLVSARNTHAIYDIYRGNSRIAWQMGGKKPGFTMGKGTRTNWQHDARWQADGTISVFDNGAFPKVEDFSRVVFLRPNLENGTVTLARSYAHPKKLLSRHQGNAQVLPNGNVFVGWGSEPKFTEFARDGKVVFDASFTRQADSYRAYRFPWVGNPRDRPAIVVRKRGKGAVVYASWNGATEVARWQVLGGQDRALRDVTTVAKHGFETTIPVQAEGFYAVRALDTSGRTLGTSATVPPGSS